MKKWIKENLFFVIFIPLGILLDQISKLLAVKNITKEIVFIKNFFSFVEPITNDGAAWNLMSGNRLILALISFVAATLLIIYYVKAPHHKLSKIGLTMVIAGAIGNGIDRALTGEVIDFINVNIFVFFNSQFPIFNIADLCVTFGAILALIGTIFFEKEE